MIHSEKDILKLVYEKTKRQATFLEAYSVISEATDPDFTNEFNGKYFYIGYLSLSGKGTGADLEFSVRLTEFAGKVGYLGISTSHDNGGTNEAVSLSSVFVAFNTMARRVNTMAEVGLHFVGWKVQLT